MLLEVKVFQQYDGQSCINTFNYVGVGTPAAVTSSFALVAAMGFIDGITPEVGNIFGSWKAPINQQLTFTEVQCRDVYSDTDFYTLPLTVNNAGSKTDTAMSSFNAFGLRSNRIRADIRKGSKRLAGVGEGDVDEFGLVGAVLVPLLETLASDLSGVLTYDDEGNVLSFTPVIVSKEKYTTPSGKSAYKYYDTELDQLAHTAVGVAWSSNPYVTTQVSRKRGRGI